MLKTRGYKRGVLQRYASVQLLASGAGVVTTPSSITPPSAVSRYRSVGDLTPIKKLDDGLPIEECQGFLTSSPKRSEVRKALIEEENVSQEEDNADISLNSEATLCDDTDGAKSTTPDSINDMLDIYTSNVALASAGKIQSNVSKHSCVIS